jgi:hypothetical protein
LSDVLDKFDAAFAGYWASKGYEDGTATPDDATRIDRVICPRTQRLASTRRSPFSRVEPWPHQREILAAQYLYSPTAALQGRLHCHRSMVTRKRAVNRTIAQATFTRNLNRLCDNYGRGVGADFKRAGGASQSTLSLMRDGNRWPSDDMLDRLCLFFKVDLQEFFVPEPAKRLVDEDRYRVAMMVTSLAPSGES